MAGNNIDKLIMAKLALLKRQLHAKMNGMNYGNELSKPAKTVWETPFDAVKMLGACEVLVELTKQGPYPLKEIEKIEKEIATIDAQWEVCRKTHELYVTVSKYAKSIGGTVHLWGDDNVMVVSNGGK